MKDNYSERENKYKELEMSGVDEITILAESKAVPISVEIKNAGESVKVIKEKISANKKETSKEYKKQNWFMYLGFITLIIARSCDLIINNLVKVF